MPRKVSAAAKPAPGGGTQTHSGAQEHGDDHEHRDGHDHHGAHKQTRAVLNRLSRTEGHLRGVRRMVETGSPCADVLIQLAAVRAAVDKIARVVLEDHVESCLRQAATNGKTDDEWTSLKEALDRFIS